MEQIILGLIQGIAEWIPVSSEGFLTLAQAHFYPHRSLETMINVALFLHLGTFFAALIYFHKDVTTLLQGFFKFKSMNIENKNLFQFLLITTALSGLLGFFLIKQLAGVIESFESSGRIITSIIGLCLLGTGFLELKTKHRGYRGLKEINFMDILILSIAQGFAALPGLSRSGLTISFLLLRKFDKQCSLRISFLMSLPIVLVGNIILNFRNFSFFLTSWVGVLVAFVSGLATIHLLLKIADKINFGFFIIGVGLLTIISSLL